MLTFDFRAENRDKEMKALLKEGTLPYMADMAKMEETGEDFSPEDAMKLMPMLMGQVAGVIDEVKPAKDIMDDMIQGAIASLQGNAAKVGPVSAIKSRL